MVGLTKIRVRPERLEVGVVSEAPEGAAVTKLVVGSFATASAARSFSRDSVDASAGHTSAPLLAGAWYCNSGRTYLEYLIRVSGVPSRVSLVTGSPLSSSGHGGEDPAIPCSAGRGRGLG